MAKIQRCILITPEVWELLSEYSELSLRSKSAYVEFSIIEQIKRDKRKVRYGERKDVYGNNRRIDSTQS